MKSLLKVQYRHLKKYWKQTLMSWLSIMIVVSLMTAVIATFSGFYSSYKLSSLKYGEQYNVYFRNVKDVDALIESGEDIVKYEYTSKVGDITAVDFNAEQHSPQTFLLYALHNEDFSFIKQGSQQTLLSGRLAENNEEMHVSEMMLEALNLDDPIGHKLDVRWADGSKSAVTIVGVVDRQYAYDNQTKSAMMSYDNTVYVQFENDTKSFEKSVISMMESNNLIDEDVVFNDFRNELLGLSDNKNIMWKVVVVMASVLLGLFTLTSIFTLYNTLNISLESKAKSLSLLSTIGVTKNQIRRSLFFEMFLTTIPCVVIGLMGGFLVSQGIFNMSYPILSNTSLFGYNIMEFAKPTLTMELISGIFIVSFIVVYIPLLRSIRNIFKESSIELIRESKRITINKKKEKTRFIKLFWGQAGVLAYKNTVRDRKKYLGLKRSLIIGTVSLVLIASFLASSLDLASAKLDHGNYAIQIEKQNIDSSAFDDIRSQIEENEDVSSTFKVTTESGRLGIWHHNDVFDEELRYLLRHKIIVLDDKDFNTLYPSVNLHEIVVNDYFEGVISDYNNGRMQISRHLTDLKVGDLVHFYTYDGTDGKSMSKTSEYPIGLKVDTFDGASSVLKFFYNESIIRSEVLVNYIVSQTLFDRIESESPYQFVLNRSLLIETEKADAVETSLIRMKPIFSIRNLASDYTQDKNVYDVIVKILFSVMGLILLMTVTSILNTTISEQDRRKGEYAILESVGMTRKDMCKMLLYESVFTIGKVIVYSIVLSFGLSYGLYAIVRKVIWMPEFNFRLDYLLYAIIGSTLILITQTLISTSMFNRESVIERLKSQKY
ncbi:ABC transporter permease [Erysipelothrix sp. strain 2 (EsS2-7-Brazil)]|uniref:ABC transporter permease n=1 Tax=Erysipelothrix sp. strain 2 (EsS2-7-Brazil) TaxID=2500579 RepID=UPI00190D6854|nr:ABC transporter permease [Erysipelothrix sp. strain 2 (EsS2-7-Brazil)]MBK2403772.1 ABC transporter permease [Erysipelothrix sp. strain 2 (EsS2-7-Brazil)]